MLRDSYSTQNVEVQVTVEGNRRKRGQMTALVHWRAPSKMRDHWREVGSYGGFAMVVRNDGQPVPTTGTKIPVTLTVLSDEGVFQVAQDDPLGWKSHVGSASSSTAFTGEFKSEKHWMQYYVPGTSFLRRYGSDGRPWVPGHNDRNAYPLK